MSAEKIIDGLSHKNRLAILEMICESKNEGIVVGMLAEMLSLTQPTTTHHLLIMKEAGLLEMNTNSYCHVYTVRVETLRKLKNYLTILIEKCERN